LRGGRIAVVRTSEPIAYLGSVLYELGAIDATTLNSTLLEVAKAKRLHGEVLVECGAITRERLADGLVEQTFRKTHHLFTLPEESTWSFRADVDELTASRDEDRPSVSTWQAIWRGMRDQPVPPHVRRTLAKVGGGIQLRDLPAIEQFGLAPDERSLCERLFAQPTTLALLIGTSPLSLERTELLVYLLAISRCIVRVDAQPLSPAELGIEGVRERARRIDDEDPTTMLGVRADASIEAARAAYFRLARLWHPARIPEALDNVRSECEHIFIKLGEAHRILTDTTARRVAGSACKPSGGAPPPEPGATSSPRITMRDVDAALARNDIEVADALAGALVSAGSDGPSARAVIAWCGAGAGMSSSSESLERAYAALEKILTGDPDCVRALFYRGQIGSRLGRVDAALRDYRKVVRLAPQHVDALRELRLHEMRHRAGTGALRGVQALGKEAANTNGHAPRETEQGRSNPDAGAAASGPESESVRSGLRRLIGRVVGK
jgi:tetratricopeptide (TPR) repeat protein